MKPQTALVIVFSLFLFFYAQGCSSLGQLFGQPSEAEQTWKRVSGDGYVSNDDMKAMDQAYDIDAQHDSMWGTLMGYGMQLLGLGLPVGAASVAATNVMRNRARRKRGEPVNVPVLVQTGSETTKHPGA